MSNQKDQSTPEQEQSTQESPEFMIIPKKDLVNITEYLGTKSYFEVAELMAGLGRAQSVVLSKNKEDLEEDKGKGEIADAVAKKSKAPTKAKK